MQQRVPEALRRAGKILSLLRGVGEARFPPPMRRSVEMCRVRGALPHPYGRELSVPCWGGLGVAAVRAAQ
eukprot:6018799-Prymnesium_polylepis.1